MKNMTNRRTLSLTVVVLLAACGGEGNEENPDTTAMADQPAAQAGGDADFLRQMSDHHEGLVLIAEQAHTRATDDSVRSAAENLHMKQAMERDSMVAMLSSKFQQRHSPEAMAKNRAQADSVAQMSGAAADRYFVQTTIAHHREGLAMIDQHMGHLTDAQVRSMAEQMRSAQQREIQELEQKLQQL